MEDCTFELSCAFAVIVVSPLDNAVIVPSELIFATSGLLLDQLIFLLVALDGNTSAVIVLVAPFNISKSLSLKTILFTNISSEVLLLVTCTKHSSCLLLFSFADTVIVANPSLCAVTFPFSSTLATLGSLLTQFTDLFVALLGFTVACNTSDSPALRDSSFLSKITFLTEMYSKSIYISKFAYSLLL